MLSGRERDFLQAVSNLAFCNPFLPERTHFERAALGSEFVEGEPIWSLDVDDPERERPNVWKVFARLEPLIEELCVRLRSAEDVTESELALYEDGVLQVLYQRFYRPFYDAGLARLEPWGAGPLSHEKTAAASRAASRPKNHWRFYADFHHDWKHFLAHPHFAAQDPTHVFACFRQVQRAFDQIFRDIIGGSAAAARLRASIWQSIFTHDMRRYRRTLYARMGEFATLITGPSGTGKELAARAIARSRYVPFDDRSLTFADDDLDLFYPINISALAATLVESELFGHRKGSFTGAVADRKGWLETCPELGSVFLDELGELDTSIQVKLLRVIETRSFHPVGDSSSKQFRGKLIAATNRDLAAGIRSGDFREDLYYRLCSDQIATPSLAEQIADSPDVLQELVVYMARRVAGPEAESLAADVMHWIETNLGRAYAWPGNFRELEQCVKNVLIRRDYRPAGTKQASAVEEILDDIRHTRLTAEELLNRYTTLVYRSSGSYEETARRLSIDRRTAKSRIDRALLARLK
jgi:DNA-binding NtrC family response regulator